MLTEHGVIALLRPRAVKASEHLSFGMIQTAPFSQWVNKLRERRGMNRAIVAVANKNARIIWDLLNRNEEFRAPV